MKETKNRLRARPRQQLRRVETDLHASCLRMLVPVAALLMRAGVGVGEFYELCKCAYVVVARDLLATPRKKANASRIAVATGLTRQEVAKILRKNSPTAKRSPKQLHRANRVLEGWHTDKRFLQLPGKPKALPVRGLGPTFQGLVRHYGGDVPHRAVLDELLRAGAVRILNTGQVSPTRRIVEYGKRSHHALNNLAQKLSLLAQTLRNNVDDPAGTLFENVVVSRPIRAEYFPIAVRRLTTSARRFLSASKNYLGSEQRQAANRKGSTKADSLGVGVFLFSKKE